MRRLLCANYSQGDHFDHFDNDHHLLIWHNLPINLKELTDRMEALAGGLSYFDLHDTVALSSILKEKNIADRLSKPQGSPQNNRKC